MAKNETRITVTAEDRASKGLKNIEERLGDLDSAAGGISGAFGSAQGAVARFGAALPLGPVGLITAGVGALGAATVGATHKLAGFVKEQSNLATVANMSLQEFSNLSYAFGTMGISAEQTADIIKDTNDRLGEFASTGKGGFADALEAMGTESSALREELVGLSGPDALIAVKKHMDAAGLSAQEQTYVMETLANDATKLIPILANEGEQLKKLAGEHQRVNDTMNEDAVAAASKYDLAVRGLMARLTDLGNTVLIPLMEILGSVIGSFNDFWDMLGDNENKIDTLTDSLEENKTALAGLEKLREDAIAKGYSQEQIDGYDREIKARKENIAVIKEETKAVKQEQEAKRLSTSSPLGSIKVANTKGQESDEVKQVKKAEKAKTKTIDREAERRKRIAEEEARRQSEVFGNMVGDSISNAESLSGVVDNMYSNMTRAMMGYVGDWVAQQINMRVVANQSTQAEGARKVAEGTATANSAAVKSYDSLAAIPIIGPALGFAAAAASWAFSLPLIANIKAAFGGAAHGGLTNVPNEQTYLLQQGERVLSPRQNQDLTSYLNSGGRGGDNISINVNANNMSPDATARAIERALKRKNKRTDRAVSQAGTRGRRNLGAAYA